MVINSFFPDLVWIQKTIKENFIPLNNYNIEYYYYQTRCIQKKKRKKCFAHKRLMSDTYGVKLVGEDEHSKNEEEENEEKWIWWIKWLVKWGRPQRMSRERRPQPAYVHQLLLMSYHVFPHFFQHTFWLLLILCNQNSSIKILESWESWMYI